MKILIFGANGMVGRYLNKYFSDSLTVTRDNLDALLIRQELFYHQMRMLNIQQGDVVINAMGLINKRNDEAYDFLVVNSIFPRLLADYCEKKQSNMIHISTDCVYDGAEGCYSEAYLHNSKHIYGLSKSLGEPNNCTVIRTSIIGESINSKKDLLEWVKSHKNTTIEGWTSHYWNGITCLQFAKICEHIISNNRFWHGVRHIYSPQSVSKAQLVAMINEIYELGNEVIFKDSGVYCNRILTSTYDLDEFQIPPIKDQIIEQKRWTSDFL